MGQVGLSHLSYMGQDGHIGLKVLVGQAGFHRTVPLVLHETGWIPLDSFMYPT